mmetsp:Transcript_72305/g.182333  ORF Transcript_72305/g.182333 Transcript_72305/m.182333 type:complete len:200 (-) Transcript_72305:359-958(-)
MLATTRFFTRLARLANSKVLLVSAWLQPAGEAAQMITVCALPPIDFCRILVSFESRKLMCFSVRASPEREEMTCDRASKDRLMFLPSLRRSPVASVCLSPSEPARSTKFKVDKRTVPSATHRDSSWTCSTACDLEERSFIFVSPLWRRRSPSSRQERMSSGPEVTRFAVKFLSSSPPCWSSNTRTSLLSALRRSNTCSL